MKLNEVWRNETVKIMHTHKIKLSFDDKANYLMILPLWQNIDPFNPIQSLFNPSSLKEKRYAFDLRLIMRHIRSLPEI